MDTPTVRVERDAETHGAGTPILVVGGSAGDQEVLAGMLRLHHYEAHRAAGPSEAELWLASRPETPVVCLRSAGGMPGPILAERLRRGGHRGRFVWVTGRESSQRLPSLARSVNVIVEAPFTAGEFLRAIGETSPSEPGPVGPSSPGPEPNPLPAPRSGVVVWCTGLSGAGKTTLCRTARPTLEALGFPVEVLDGDEIRRVLSSDLGFSREDRERQADRVAYVASLLARHGVAVLVALISPYRSSRERARQTIGKDRFLEVYVRAPLETCRARDPKSLYREAALGRIPSFTGLQDPYEAPENPDLLLDTESMSLDACVTTLVEALLERGFRPRNPSLLLPAQMATSTPPQPVSVPDSPLLGGASLVPPPLGSANGSPAG
jgi:adenylylsulfate kinase